MVIYQRKPLVREWIGIYRAVTGACAAGIRNFVGNEKEILDKSYTVKDIVKNEQRKIRRQNREKGWQYDH